MFCKICKFYQGGFMWNRCDLMEAEYFTESNKEPCSLIDDNYIFLEDCEPLGFVKGKSAIEFMEGGAGNGS